MIPSVPPLMPSLVLAREGFAIRVESPDRADLEWLEENLAPGFRPAGAAPPLRCVTKLIDARRHRALLERGPAAPEDRVRCFGFDGHGGTCLRWNAPATTLYDDELDVFYVVADDVARVEVVAPSSRPSTRIALLRLVREFATHHLTARGSLQFHGAALAHEGRGVLIAGARRAGKTSLLIHGLGEAGSLFIANDRALVSRDPRGEWRLGGMPTVITIRPDSAAILDRPDLAAASRWSARLTLAEAAELALADANRPPPRPSSVSPRQFCHLTGTVATDSAPLRVVVFPRVDAGSTGMQFTRLAPAAVAERLDAHRLHPADTVFRADAPPAPATAPASLLAGLRASIPALECVLGRQAFADRTMAAAIFSALDRLPGASPT